MTSVHADLDTYTRARRAVRGCSAGELVLSNHGWPAFIPGHSLRGSAAALTSSSTALLVLFPLSCSSKGR